MTIYFHRSRYTYWSCTKLAGKIRQAFSGKPNLKSGTAEEWDDYEKHMKKTAPFINWLTNDGFDGFQNILYFPYDLWRNFHYLIQARYVKKYHTMSSKLDPWSYVEINTRMLHCNFETLVGFVEVECAWNRGAAESKAKWYHRWFSGYLDYRCPEEGLAHLEWASKLTFDGSYGETPESEHYGKPTPQAERAKEILALYHWWKVRDLRIDPMIKSGYSKWCDEHTEESPLSILKQCKTPEDEEKLRSILADLHRIEEEQENEETEMLCRLMKCRDALWT